MNPTNNFRWLVFTGSSMYHPSARIYTGNKLMVMQQLWVSNYEGENDEWRDIEMVETCNDSDKA